MPQQQIPHKDIREAVLDAPDVELFGAKIAVIASTPRNPKVQEFTGTVVEVKSDEPSRDDGRVLTFETAEKHRYGVPIGEWTYFKFDVRTARGEPFRLINGTIVPTPPATPTETPRNRSPVRSRSPSVEEIPALRRREEVLGRLPPHRRMSESSVGLAIDRLTDSAPQPAADDSRVLAQLVAIQERLAQREAMQERLMSSLELLTTQALREGEENRARFADIQRQMEVVRRGSEGATARAADAAERATEVARAADDKIERLATAIASRSRRSPSPPLASFPAPAHDQHLFSQAQSMQELLATRSAAPSQTRPVNPEDPLRQWYDLEVWPTSFDEVDATVKLLRESQAACFPKVAAEINKAWDDFKAVLAKARNNKGPHWREDKRSAWSMSKILFQISGP